jgi:hypothetical protein
MADKNYAGAQMYRQERRENRLIEKIDYREKNGKNRENVDEQFSNFTINKDGSKVWSF